MARPVPSGPPPPPIVQRLAIRYAKRGRMRFASHRDVARAIERGVRKAGVPIAYSAGFSPHPRISYSGGAPTGSASEAEYLEISLVRRCEPADLGRLLDAALPDGIDVVDVVEVDGKSAALELDASRWEVLVPGVPVDALRTAADAFLATPSVLVERLTSKGTRRLDARAAVLVLTVDRHVGADPAVGCAIIRMVVQHLTPAVRPEDIMTALAQFAAPAPSSPPLVTRLWQGPLRDAAEAQALGTASFGTASFGTASFGTASFGPVPFGPVPLGAQALGTRAVATQVPATAVLATGVLVTQEGAIGVTRAAESPVLDLRAAAESLPARRLLEPESASPSAVAPAPAASPELVTDQATRLRAGSAATAPARSARANDQLLRGERAESTDSRAREPQGRDCPNARNRAAEPTARSE
jgi:radical SAM-linked protein